MDMKPTQEQVIEWSTEAGLYASRQTDDKFDWKIIYAQQFATIAYEAGRKDENEALMQIFTDPENQPSQFGTVTLEYMQREIDAERDECAKICHGKALELKDRAMKETVKTQRARLTSEAVGWHDAFSAIRARRKQ